GRRGVAQRRFPRVRARLSPPADDGAGVPVVGRRARSGGAGAAPARARRPRVRALLEPAPPVRPRGRAGRGAAVSRRPAAAAARPERDVLRLGAVRARARARLAAVARRDGAERPSTGRARGKPRRARLPPRALDAAGPAERAVPAVGELLPPAVRLARVRL